MTRPDPHASYREHVSSEAEAVEEIGIVERLRFDAVRCEIQFSKGVARNISEAADEIESLRAQLSRAIARDSGGYAPNGRTWKQAVMDEAARRGEAEAQLATARKALEGPGSIEWTISRLEEDAERHGCSRCWSDDLGRPCTCNSERALIRLTLAKVRAALNSGEQK